MSGGRVEPYDDDLEHYSERIRIRIAPATTNAPPNRRERRQVAAEHRRQTQELRNVIKRLEANIESTANSVKDLDATLADPVTYETMSTQNLQNLIAQRTALVRELNVAEGDWLHKHQELDAAIAVSQRDAELDPDDVA